MQTGPRTASTAQRCSAFTPATIASTSMRPPYGRGETEPCRVCDELVDGVFEDGRVDLDTPRRADHRREPRDHVERVAALDHPLELSELVLEPLGVDRVPRGAEDLRMRRRPDVLALVPQLLVQLLVGTHAHEVDRNVRVGLLA